MRVWGVFILLWVLLLVWEISWPLLLKIFLLLFFFSSSDILILYKLYFLNYPQFLNILFSSFFVFAFQFRK